MEPLMSKRAAAITSAVLVLLLAAVAGAFAWATGGRPPRDPSAWLTAGPIAHRGQWDGTPRVPENSLAAFDAAAARGFAIELDVLSSSDGVTMVMHDDELARMTGAPGRVSETSAAALAELRLLGGDEPVPTLAEALETIGGRVPVFVEIKNRGGVGTLEDDVARQLAAYAGEAVVMSFNPYSLARVAKTAPEVPRGQLSGDLSEEGLAWYEVFLLENLMMDWSSKPDFIAYDLDELPSLGTSLQRLRGRPLLAWTAEDAAERLKAEGLADAVICDPDALPRR
ncbi:MAG: glycerophosphodiester phosphodiesterase [Actinobacteria bacterium]|nr:MAG: glycerophosphodiester phosphodiesterase [Actinomycetota bacterium]